MDDAMLGVSRRDYKQHSGHFSVTLKSVIGPDEFLSDCDTREKQWGTPLQRNLVAIFRKEKSFTLVWDQQFNQTDGQVVAMLTIALKGGRYFVDGFSLT